jgi:hypothetical protein
MASVYTVGEIRKITSKYTQNKVGRWQFYILLKDKVYKIVIFQPCSVYMLMLLLLISPTVYTIAIFQPGSVYIWQVYILLERVEITSKYTQNKVGRWQLYILLER